MNCIEATRLISEGLERPLGRGEKTQLRFHTLMCSGCRNFERQAPMLRTISRNYTPLIDLPTETSDEKNPTGQTDA